MHIRYKRKYVDQWHRWYAWYPVRFYSRDEGCNVFAWLTQLRRRRITKLTLGLFDKDEWEYDTLQKRGY